MITEKESYIIAEAGVNHNGSLEMALRLVDEAATAGVNAVKFQTFRSEDLVSRHAGKADYQRRTTDAAETQLEMLRKLELGPEDFDKIAGHAAKRGVEFLSTPFDSASLRLLTGHFQLKKIKVSSGDLTNAPFLLEVARAAETVILSTGMSTLGEVEAALGVLAFGFSSESGIEPSPSAFAAAFATDAGQKAIRERVAVLHCTTEYPAPFREVNLSAMDTLRAAFGVLVGYSDHTPGIHIPIAAVARGARIIEKHFTLDRTLPGPDHAASLEPDELLSMVRSIRDVESALGDGIKRPTESEWKNRNAARKSLVAGRPIKAGEGFDVVCKRPGSGISPFEYWTITQKVAGRDYAEDEAIDV